MHGALVLLTALVLSGFASGAHAAPVRAVVPACEGTAADDGRLGDEREDSVSEDAPGRVCMDSAGFRWERGPRAAHRRPGEVATPAVIGCALIFGHTRTPNPPEARPWSCEESGRVYNTWYRVSRTPEVESARLAALGTLERTNPESSSPARWASSEAPGPRGTGVAGSEVPVLPVALVAIPPTSPRLLGPVRVRVLALSRPIPPPERPPRGRA